MTNFGTFWHEVPRDKAKEYLEEIIDEMRSTALKPLKKMANTIETHIDGIMNYFKHPIMNGPLEALNNVFGLIIRKAFGYRNREFLKLRILFYHETRRLLSGV